MSEKKQSVYLNKTNFDPNQVISEEDHNIKEKHDEDENNDKTNEIKMSFQKRKLKSEIF